jgi:hypothetical protein
MTTSNQQAAQDEYARYRERIQEFTVSELLAMKAKFQRQLNFVAVRKIVREWNIDLWEMPVVGELPDGTHVLSEGQHRSHAAARVLGLDAKIQCRVVYTTQPGKLFSDLNTAKRRVGAIDIFLADASDGDSDAAVVQALARSHGFEVAKSGKGSRNIQGAGTMMNLYRIDGVTLGTVLSIIDGVMKLRDEESGWVRGNVLTSVHVFVRVTQSYKQQDLVSRLARGNSQLAAPYPASDVLRNLQVITDIYNRGRREENRVDISESWWRYQQLVSHSKLAFSRHS